MMYSPKVRNPYNYDVDEASAEAGLVCPEETLTKQSFQEEVDINTIVRRFNLTGQLPENVAVPTYADFDEIFDFHSAMNVVAQAGEAFGLMPADVRARFHNDPGEFMDFVHDDRNYSEAVKLGLVMPPPVEGSGPASGPLDEGKGEPPADSKKPV